MTDIATIWRDEATARAQRAAAAIAAGGATQAQADSDARLCDLITRHLIPGVTAAKLMAGSAHLIDDLMPAARLYFKITRDVPALRLHANWAWIEVEEARMAIWQAHRFAGRVKGNGPAPNWRCSA